MGQLVPPFRRPGSPGWALDISIGALALTVVAALLLGWPQLPVATAASGVRVGSSTVAVQLPAAAMPSDDTLQLLVGGTPQPLAASGEIPIGGSLFGQIVVSHSNDRPLLRNLDIFLYQNPSAAQPVVGASVQAVAHMYGMSGMGTVQQVGTPSGTGHYLVSLDLPMPGEWQVDLIVNAATEHPTIETILYVWT